MRDRITHLSLNKTGARHRLRSRFILACIAVSWAGCSVFYTRPLQEMSDTAAAIRAAREVQADTLAPELYRESTEWFNRSKREYQFKNFKLAKDYADKARGFAEQAEFESIRSGGNRTEIKTTDPFENAAPPPANTPTPAATPYDYPAPKTTPGDSLPDTVPAPPPLPSPLPSST